MEQDYYNGTVAKKKDLHNPSKLRLQKVCQPQTTKPTNLFTSCRLRFTQNSKRNHNETSKKFPLSLKYKKLSAIHVTYQIKFLLLTRGNDAWI